MEILPAGTSTVLHWKNWAVPRGAKPVTRRSRISMRSSAWLSRACLNTANTFQTNRPIRWRSRSSLASRSPSDSVGMDYGQLRNLTAREIISALIRDGFAFDRGDGSHQIYYHPDRRRVTVMFHGSGNTFTRKTLKSMIKQ